MDSIEQPQRRKAGRATREEQIALDNRRAQIEKMLADNLPGRYIAAYFNIDEAVVSRIKKQSAKFTK